MKRRRALQVAATLVAGSLAGCNNATRSSTPSTATLTPVDVPAGTVTVEVGPLGAPFFKPGTGDPLTVPTGTTVRFVWRTDDHNLVIDEQPEGGSWAGTPGGLEDLYNTGYVHEYTFEVPGRYTYYCAPHESAGMWGSIRVE
jgi:plastocyanin